MSESRCKWVDMAREIVGRWSGAGQEDEEERAQVGFEGEHAQELAVPALCAFLISPNKFEFRWECSLDWPSEFAIPEQIPGLRLD